MAMVGMGVKGLILCGEMVLLLQKPNGEYDLPGGRLERGEGNQDGLEREIFEETGLSKIEIYDWFTWWALINRQGLTIEGTTWVCHFRGGQISISNEHRSYAWTPLTELRALEIYRRYGLDELGSHCRGTILEEGELQW